jgi:Xaa-Pro aminopeptidase
MLWEKADSVLLRNFHDHFKDPLINKYLNTQASEKLEGYLILNKNRIPTWVSHPFNYTIAKKMLPKANVVSFETKKDIQRILKEECGERVGFNGNFISYNSVKNLRKLMKGKKLIDVSKELEEEREIKNKEEIEKIKKAVSETKKVLSIVISDLKEGISEKEVEERISHEFKKEGYTTAFCIVAFGENTANIHHVSCERKLAKNEAVMIDVGAKYDGYCADISETTWFGKKEGKEFETFNEERKKIELTQKAVEDAIKPSAKAKEIYKAAEKILGKMPHAIGHGIGIEVHDYPIGIGEKSKWVLKEGMVIAIEPAIYNKNFGIRLEKDYLITKKGCEEL